MARPKKIKKDIPEIKIARSPGVFNIRILGPDGKVRGKNGMNKTEVFDFYFVGLSKNLEALKLKYGNLDDTFAKLIYDKYKTIYSKHKFKYQYVDSYGHLWEGKNAQPPEKWAIEYLKKKINENG